MKERFLGLRQRVIESVSNIPAKAITYAQELREDISILASRPLGKFNIGLASSYIVGGLSATIFALVTNDRMVGLVGSAFLVTGFLHLDSVRSQAITR